MKKKVLCILTAILVISCFSFGSSAAFEEYTGDIDNPPVVIASPEEDLTGPEAIPSHRLKPLVVDEAGLLSTSEENSLVQKLEALSEEKKFEIAVVTVLSTEGQLIRDFADDFYDYNGYGYGENRDGLMLVLDMSDRSWWVSTCGKGEKAFSTEDINTIISAIGSQLSSGDYYSAFSDFADLSAKHLDKSGKVPLYWIPVDAAVGFLVAYLVMKNKTKDLKSVRKQTGAGTYVVPGSLMMYGQNDRFITMSVSQTPVVRSSSGGSSGSHTSSSGTSHGGTGGHF